MLLLYNQATQELYRKCSEIFLKIDIHVYE